jgi:tetratricopeptide (TPR) repeat protein
MRKRSEEPAEYAGGHATAAQLVDYLESERPAEKGAALRAHLKACTVCRRRLRRTLEDPQVRRTFITVMLEAGRDCLHRGSLEEAWKNYYVAVDQALQLPEGDDPAMAAYLRFKSWCELANVERALNELDEAEESLCAARDHLDKTSGYAAFEARWHDVAGSLFRGQRRFDEAIEAFKIAEAHYLAVDYTHEAGRCRLNLGSVYLAVGEPRRALQAMISAHGLVDLTDKRFTVGVFHNMLFALTEAGELAGLSDALRRSRSAYRAYGTPLLRIRRLGLLAKVAAGEGRFRSAERLFRHEIAGFQMAGHRYDAAIAALDVAILMARQGRPSTEILALLDGAVAAFVERFIYRELFMSFEVLRDSFRTEQGTAEALAGFAAALRTEIQLPEAPL